MLKKCLISLCLVLTFIVTPPVFAADTNLSVQGSGSSLSIQQAVDLALKNSRALKQAEYNVERGKEVQEAADLKVQYIPVSPSTSPVSDAYYTAAAAASISARTAVKTKMVEEDNVILSVFEKYCALLNAIEDRDYAYKSFKNSQMQLNNSRISNFNGVISASQLQLVESGYKAAKSTLEQSELKLDEAYRAFNSLIGYTADSRPTLTEKPMYSAFEVTHPETEVSRILDECPTVWSAEQAAKLANLKLSLWNPNDLDPYEAQQIDVKKAELAAADAKEQMRNLIRLLYNSVKQCEDGYVALNEQVSIASEQLRVKQLLFNNGMATQYEVDTAELELTKAEKSLNNIIYQHEYLESAFKKPWAYISSAQ